jgi:acetoacetate decarboxylase
MTEDEIRATAFAMPITCPAFPCGPYRFYNREYLIITYRTDRAVLERLVPAPLEIAEPLVKYEFIAMPDSTGFGSYHESGQVIPVRFHQTYGSYVHSMYLNDHAPIAGGRELWGFPKKLAEPDLHVVKDTLIGTLDCCGIRIATGSMGYKHRALEPAPVLSAFYEPNFLLKIIPHVDGTARICELVQYTFEDVQLKGAWSGPGMLELHPHALAPVADLPILEVVSSVHILCDLTLPLGTVAHDYLGRWSRSIR